MSIDILSCCLPVLLAEFLLTELSDCAHIERKNNTNLLPSFKSC